MQIYLKGLNIWNTCQVYSVESVSKNKSIISMTIYAVQGMGNVFSAYSVLSWWLWEYAHFILLSPSNRKYESLDIIQGSVMKQWHALYILLCSVALLVHGIECSID